MDLTSGLDPDRELLLADAPDDPSLREAVNMWIWDDEARFGLPRIAVEAIGRRWEDRAVQVNVGLPGGRVLLGTQVGKARPTLDRRGRPRIFGAGPLQFECLEPFDRWSVYYQGMARDTTVAEQVKGSPGAIQVPVAGDTSTELEVEFSVECMMAVPAWQPGQMSRKAKEVLEKGPEGDFVSTRYEQLFRAEGSFRVEGEYHEFSGGGLRIRRQGRRDSSELWGHCWQSAVFPSGRAFGMQCFPPRANGSPSYNEAYVFDGEAMIPAEAVKVPWMTEFVAEGGDVSLALETDDGVVEIRAETVFSTFVRRVSELNEPFGLPFLGGADRLVFHQGIARYRWGDEEAYGMIERSYPLVDVAGI